MKFGNTCMLHCCYRQVIQNQQKVLKNDFLYPLHSNIKECISMVCSCLQRFSTENSTIK